MDACMYACTYVYAFGCNNKEEVLILKVNQGDIGGVGDIIEMM